MSIFLGGRKLHSKTPKIFCFHFHSEFFWSNLPDAVVVNADGINCGLVITTEPKGVSQPTKPGGVVVLGIQGGGGGLRRY